MNNTAIDDLLNHLYSAGLDARVDLPTRLLYSTDASIYQVEPLGVVFPRHADELQAVVEACAHYRVPLLARGAGSSLGGQAIGPALIVDCSRHLNKLVEIDPELRIAVAEPGIVLNALNRAAARHGLTFGPDPASAERATLGGSMANNAAGAHSIVYGMCADHILAADVVLSDGSLAHWAEEPIPPGPPSLPARGEIGRNAAVHAAALQIREEYGEAIRQGWPKVWRRASGYNLNYLLPWSPGAPPFYLPPGEASLRTPPSLKGRGREQSPLYYSESEMSRLPLPSGRGPGSGYPPVQPGHLNLAQLLAGSEGTLAVMRRLTVRLSPIPKHTLLAIYTFPSLAAACDAAPLVLEHHPSAVELIPGVLIQLARSVPAYAAQLTLLSDLGAPGEEPPAILAVEFSGAGYSGDEASAETQAALKGRAQALQRALAGQSRRMLLAESKAAQAQVWTVRKVGLGLIMSRPGDVRPYSFIEDLAVPVERLGEFVRGMERILEAHGVQGENYGHASAGCLHIRPLLNLKTASGVHDLRSIATAAVDLTLGLGGSVSGEHADGYARSEWYTRMFGPEIMQAFRVLKRAADPHELLNPGKMVTLDEAHPVPRMDENLRFGSAYQAQAWTPGLAFDRAAAPERRGAAALRPPSTGHVPEGAPEDAQSLALATAIEHCNGAGVCRKAEGVMCPSFQATHEEQHSTRGRANLLRALISGRFPSPAEGQAAVFEALDLCLACKGCKAECPSGVDVAKLKYTFMDHYYAAHRRKLRDYLFGYIGPIAALAHGFAPLVNPFLRFPWFTRLFERLLGVSAQRRFPAFARRSLEQQAQRDGRDRRTGAPGYSFRDTIRIARTNLAGNKNRNLSADQAAAPDPGVYSFRGSIRIDTSAHPDNLKIDQSLKNPSGLDLTSAGRAPDRVLFLSDPFTEYMTPNVGLAALAALQAAGCQVTRLPVIGAGRTLISKGFLKAAKKQARKVLQAILAADPTGTLPVVGVEPSEVHALLDEYLDLLPGDASVQALAKRAWTVEEFLLRPGTDGRPRIEHLAAQRGDAGEAPSPDDGAHRDAAPLRPDTAIHRGNVYLHGHCYQKARPPADDGLPVGAQASAAALAALGHIVHIVDDGCCGMAGAFGYEADHYAVSMQVGELALFPAIRAAEAGACVAAAGVSCREQIFDGTQREAKHPIQLLMGG